MKSDETWLLAPKRLCLPDQEVHVWRAGLDLSTGRLRGLRAILSEEERQRADRLLRVEDQRRSVAGRGILRTLLGRYLGQEPAGLRFLSGKHGKPSLASDSTAPPSGKPARSGTKPFPRSESAMDDYAASPPARRPREPLTAEPLRPLPRTNGKTGCEAAHGMSSLCFNLSHSGSLLLIGIAAGLDLGIDVEQVRPMRSAERLVRRFFSEREQEEFRSVPEPLKLEAFFTCWSRKEAFLKALGRGLSHPLNRFSVSVPPGEPIRFRCEEPGSGSAAGLWTFREIRPGEGYVAALAMSGPPRRLRCWQWR